MKIASNNTSLLDDIKAGGMKRQQAIAMIYKDSKLRNMVIRFVKNNKGDEAQGIDMFHEGIIVLDRNVRNGKFRGEGDIKGYLYSICRFLWFNQLKKDKRMVYTDEQQQLDAEVAENPETLSLNMEQKKVLNHLLATLGEKCKQILELWKLSYSMEEIAEKVGLGNAGIARRQRYNCYQKLMTMIDENPSVKQFLKK